MITSTILELELLSALTELVHPGAGKSHKNKMTRMIIETARFISYLPTKTRRINGVLNHRQIKPKSAGLSKISLFHEGATGQIAVGYTRYPLPIMSCETIGEDGTQINQGSHLTDILIQYWAN
jgi:hypothetical protein